MSWISTTSISLPDSRVYKVQKMKKITLIREWRGPPGPQDFLAHKGPPEEMAIVGIIMEMEPTDGESRTLAILTQTGQISLICPC
jgi:hypothetical protein